MTTRELIQLICRDNMEDIIKIALYYDVTRVPEEVKRAIRKEVALMYSGMLTAAGQNGYSYLDDDDEALPSNPKFYLITHFYSTFILASNLELHTTESYKVKELDVASAYAYALKHGNPVTHHE